MSDRERQELARESAQGDEEAQARLLAARLRRGELDPARIELAAYCASSPAQSVQPTDAPLQLSSWVFGVARFGPEAARVVAEVLAGLLDETFDPDAGLEAWAESYPPASFSDALAREALGDAINSLTGTNLARAATRTRDALAKRQAKGDWKPSFADRLRSLFGPRTLEDFRLRHARAAERDLPAGVEQELEEQLQHALAAALIAYATE